MRATLALWWLLRRRSAGRGDSQSLTGALAILAFAVTTAVLLVVVGGVQAFEARAAADPENHDLAIYPALAYIAAGLLVIPIATLGSAAARLAMARRDARLAALRLAGATTSQVGMLTLLEAGAQAVLGAALGIAGYLALIPVVALVQFNGRPFAWAELWAGPGITALAVAGVVIVALASAAVSLRRVAITPLGVAARVSPPGLRWTRLLLGAAAIVAWLVAINTGQLGFALLLAIVVAGFATLNVVGPFAVWVVGAVTTTRARDVSTLLAGRRMRDNPRGAWRAVGGVTLATFIAGMTTVAAVLGSMGDADETGVMRDIGTGGLLTLAIAGALAAVSTGVMQSGRLIDQRPEHRSLRLAGADLRVMRRAQWREVAIPMAVGMGSATAMSMLFVLPLFGSGAILSPAALIQFFGCVLAAFALVALGVWATRPLQRALLAD